MLPASSVIAAACGMVQDPVRSGFPVNVAKGPVVATLGPASTVPVVWSVDKGPWLLSVSPAEFVKMIVVEPRESVVVSLGHPTKNGTVTLTFPHTCELKFAAAPDMSAGDQAYLPRSVRTCLVCLIAIF